MCDMTVMAMMRQHRYRLLLRRRRGHCLHGHPVHGTVARHRRRARKRGAGLQRQQQAQ